MRKRAKAKPKRDADPGQPEPPARDTRAAILQAALGEFAQRGYYATTVQVIANRVGITKTAVLYHFPEKSDLLAALAAPLLDDVERALRFAEDGPPTEARWRVIEGILDTWLAHRVLLTMSLKDMALSAAQPVFEKFRDLMLRANVLVAGKRPTFGAQVEAAQVIAMLGDPVVLFADADADRVRAEVLRGVAALLGAPVPSHKSPLPRPPSQKSPAPARSQRGRPSALSPADEHALARLRRDGATAEEIAAALGVSRATVYRHLGAESA